MKKPKQIKNPSRSITLNPLMTLDAEALEFLESKGPNNRWTKKIFMHGFLDMKAKGLLPNSEPVSPPVSERVPETQEVATREVVTVIPETPQPVVEEEDDDTMSFTGEGFS